MTSPGSADVSVRPARASDAAAVAEVQLETWRSGYAQVLPAGALDAVTDADAEAHWRDAVLAPPSPLHTVFVALHAGRLVGFAAIGPSEDDDATEDRAEILELIVGPGFQQAGHGSRLLSAAVDRLEEQGVRSLVTWRFADDEPALTFFRSAGWANDGSRRTLDMGEPVEQVRLHTEVGISVTPTA
ncbi:MAG TPA: GNAT family N-acetyltransferase [Frankiaceae bacterium]|nr:GNAT family N-acetyltransferase [Frankiaceae bacterium]